MSTTYQVLFNGAAADDSFYNQLASLEVEENADLPGAIQMTLPVSTANGDLTFVNDSRFAPFANVAVVVNPPTGSAACIFDGYVLTSKLHLERGIVSSKLEVWGQDASWLMNLEEKVNEWADVTDSDVAASIFGNYGFTPAGDNSQNDSPSHTSDNHSLMQRGTDMAFLRSLAQATGKWCRVACADQAGVRTGYFARPNLDGSPTVTLDLNDPQNWNVGPLDLEWDVTRPTSVTASQLFQDSGAVTVNPTDSGLTALDRQTLASFSTQTTSVLLAAPADSSGELTLRAQGLLEDANWFARCEGETDIARLQQVLRVGDLVAIAGIGSIHSGNYLVWSVRHSIAADSHKMHFVLVRNAMGPAPSASGGLTGMLGGL
jgi:phage protein D